MEDLAHAWYPAPVFTAVSSVWYELLREIFLVFRLLTHTWQHPRVYLRESTAWPASEGEEPMRRDDLLAEEYECLITLWEIEDKVETVETETEIQLFYKAGALAEMEQTWDSLDSRQKISLATLVGLHFGIPILPEDLACMTMNALNTPEAEWQDLQERRGLTLPKPSLLDEAGSGPRSLSLFRGE